MCNLCDMAPMLLIGESRLSTLSAVNGLGVAEKSLATTVAGEAQSRPSMSAAELQKAAPAPSVGSVEMLLVAIIGGPTVRAY